MNNVNENNGTVEDEIDAPTMSVDEAIAELQLADAARAKAQRLESINRLVANVLLDGRMNGFTRHYSAVVNNHVVIGIDGYNYNLYINEEPMSWYTAQKLYAQMATDNGHKIIDWVFVSNDEIGYITRCTECGELMSIPRTSDIATAQVSGTMHKVPCIALPESYD